MLKVTNLQKTYGTQDVLTNVTFALGSGQRAALVGHNGTGKTTILKIVAGIEAADGGKVELAPGARVGYLAQDTSAMGESSVLDYLRERTGVAAIEKEMEKLCEDLSGESAQNRYGDLQTLYERMDGYQFEHRAEAVLAGFGLGALGLSTSVAHLSGGQKTKVGLAAILLQNNDVLLLDEPTNNLDLPALIWLEEYLRLSPATVLLVSHDRRFIDRVAEKIVELDWRSRTVTVTNGAYTDYLVAKERATERQQQEYEEQQEEIDRLSDRADAMRRKSASGSRWVGSDNDKFIRGFRRDGAGKSGQGAKALEKRIEQMDKVEKPFEREGISLVPQLGVGEGNRDIVVEDLVAGYPGGFSVGPVSFVLPFGKAVAVVGLNGSGKSTLLKTIAGHLRPLSGEAKIGSGVVLCDMLQEHESLPRDLTPVAFLQQALGTPAQEAYAQLAVCGIDDESFNKEIGTLSPGFRARLLLALFAAKGANVLILDEPTNHLDLEALDALEFAIEEYKGTLLVVSHDRYFLDRLGIETIWLVEEGKIKEVESFSEYLRAAEKRAQRLLRTR